MVTPDTSASAALVELSPWTGIEVQGPEARKWLNGMITANVRDLAPGRRAPSFQLDPKGHIRATLDVVCLEPERFLLLTDVAQGAGLEAGLRKFVFIAKLTLSGSGEPWRRFRLSGDGAARALQAAWGGEGADEEITPGRAIALDAEGSLVWAAGHSAPHPLALEMIVPTTQAEQLWQRLAVHADVRDAAAEERARILRREPRYGDDITAAELPQETGQLDRLDFTKGCYVGQEIVERIRARGAVHRHLRGFRFAAAVAAPGEITVEGRVEGKVTSVARDGATWLALGYIRDPHAAAGTPIVSAGVAGEVLA